MSNGSCQHRIRWRTREVKAVRLAPREGLEPSTCPLGGGRAIQLCHRGGLQLTAQGGGCLWYDMESPMNKKKESKL